MPNWQDIVVTAVFVAAASWFVRYRIRQRRKSAACDSCPVAQPPPPREVR